MMFAKAFALTALLRPELRRAYVGLPTPRIYESNHSTLSFAIERDYGGEPAVMTTLIRRPEERAIADLDVIVRRHKTEPVESIAKYRRMIRTSRLWTPIRRVIWWAGLNFSGETRAREFGTFSMSTYGAFGAQSLHPISPVLPLLSFGPIDADGTVKMLLVYDHRVTDGAQIARSLVEIERTLNTAVLAELVALPRVRAVDQIDVGPSSYVTQINRAA
jgi:hypothetical protein